MTFYDVTDTSRGKITRRALLQSAAATGLAAAFASPGRVAEAAGASSYALDVVFAEIDTPGVEIRTYGGKSSGPTISVMPGDTFHVHVKNSLPAEPPEAFCTGDDINQFHAANTTNLHVHGLHVSPTVASNGEDSDNIFLSIVPEGQEIPPDCHAHGIRKVENSYTFELPEDHPSGTFWYHAHKHGSTAQQVSQGLLGPLIIRDKPGTMPRYIEDAPEDILLIQTRGITKDAPAPGDSCGNPTLVLVDPSGEGGGTINPVITMAPGEVRRWRFINGAPRADAFVSFNVQDEDGNQPLEFYQIAFDGLTYERRVNLADHQFDPDDPDRLKPWINPFAMAPGNRMDVMVRVPRDTPEGELKLVALQLPNDMPGMDMAGLAMSTENCSATSEITLDLSIRVEGDPVDAEWSDDPSLPGAGPLTAPITDDELVTERNIVFNLNFSGPGATTFNIDDLEFNGQVQKAFKLGTAEQWQVRNVNTFTHPFHIHVNPFFVTHIDGVELEEGNPLRRWQDTMAIPTSTSGDWSDLGWYTARSRFLRFTGDFVIHCHILDHEDQGMMQKVAVVP